MREPAWVAMPRLSHLGCLRLARGDFLFENNSNFIAIWALLLYFSFAVKPPLLLFLVLFAASSLFAASPGSSGSLLTNGDFSVDSRSSGTPEDWGKLPAGVSWSDEGGMKFLRFESQGPDQAVVIHRTITLPSPAPEALELRTKVRYQDIKPGAKPWFDGRIMAGFKDATGQAVKGRYSPPVFRGSSPGGWVEKSVFFAIPAGAVSLEIMPALIQTKAGTLDFAAIDLFPAGAGQVPPPPPPPAPPAQYSSETLPVEGKLPPELKVRGNQIVTTEGKEVWLQGLCLDSLEWGAEGERLEQSLPVAITDWKANVIRLPVHQRFWFGHGPYQRKDWGGLEYRRKVDNLIRTAAAQGVYVVLDLHQFGAPEKDHVTFWKDAATRYKNHPAVLFEIFNEPHGISWEVWRNGGELAGKENENAPQATAENQEKIQAKTSVGMQGLVEAVRGTGARNIIIAGGVAWGYDISGVLQGYALDDLGGNGIVYSSHVYPWKKDWQEKFLAVAEKYPLFIGELGAPEKWADFSFIPADERYEDLAKLEWPPDMIGLIQKHRLHWTGFSFHPGCGPPLIKDWSYTPTPYWGIFVKEALAGKTFEMQRMR